MISGPLLGTLLHQVDSRAPYLLVAALLLLAVAWAALPRKRLNGM